VSGVKCMDRAWQISLIVAVIGFSWLGLQVVHEAGHVLHAWASGGTVIGVVLRPTTVSETLVWPNPRPQFVAWGGPIWGCAIPLVLWGVTWLAARRYAFLARFFAGACLVGNGAYLGASTLASESELDAPVILAQGGAAWQTLLFAVVAMVSGFYVWNGLESAFGLGDAKGRVDRSATVVAVAILAIVVVTEFGLSK
jgi:hypothetical protein